jgi:hypothetical protein
VNLVRGLLPHVLPLVWGVASTLLWRHASKTADWVPITVRGLLRNPKVRAELGQIVADMARYANLSNQERRQRAIEFVRAALFSRGISVTDQEIATLVELLYGQLKRDHPTAVAPEPLLAGTRHEG